MDRKLDIDSWNRKEHFNFFKGFEEPFFGVTVTIDCTKAYSFCKKNQQSFFIYYLHKSLKAVNAIENFKYRIIDNEVIVYDQINGSATIGRPDGTFGFSYIEYDNEFEKFKIIAKNEINHVTNSQGLRPAESGENVIHYSSLPWINFTGLSHARSFSRKDSCPKISFGKLITKNQIKEMSMSIHVHHALVDGIHVGNYIDTFQELMNQNIDLK